VERIGPELSKTGKDPAKWFAAYTRDDGWHTADGLQRRLETWVAHMDEEPEAEQALGVVRDAHEQLLRAMAEGFSDALEAAGWQVPSTLHQTQVYPDVVETMGGRVAYFLVDAMRFEMGVELAHQIEGATDLTVSAAVSALPSITAAGTVRVSGAELGYHTHLDFIFPTGLGVLKAGGGLSFHHGGFSLQDLAMPVISLRMASGKSAAMPGIGVRIEDCPVAVTNRTFGLKLVVQGDLLATEPLTLRMLLMAGSDEVGRAGMAVGGDFDRGKGSLTLPLGATASVGMMLNNDTCTSLRVVVLDAGTDGVLAQSNDLPVKLGI